MYVRDLAYIKSFQRTNGFSYKLRYLAKFFFNETIQDGQHDSIIDANMTLQLYKKYLKMPVKSPVNYQIAPKNFWKASKLFINTWNEYLRQLREFWIAPLDLWSIWPRIRIMRFLPLVDKQRNKRNKERFSHKTKNKK